MPRDQAAEEFDPVASMCTYESAEVQAMRTYIRSITTFFRWTHRDSLFVLSEDEVDCLVVEALASKARWS